MNLQALAFSLALSSAPALALHDSPGGTPPEQPIVRCGTTAGPNAGSPGSGGLQTPDGLPVRDADIELSLNNFVTLAELGLPVQGQLDELLAAVERWRLDEPHVAGLRGRFAAHVERMIHQARTSWVSHLDAAFLREQFFEARLDGVLDDLVRRAHGGGWDHETYEEVLAALVARARAAVDFPEAEFFRARLEAVLESARFSAADRVQELRRLRMDLLQSRIYRAYQFLDRRAKLMGATPDMATPLIQLLLMRGQALAGEVMVG